jgi:hypothetical protein
MSNETAFYHFISLFPKSITDEVEAGLNQMRAQGRELPALNHPLFDLLATTFEKHLQEDEEKEEIQSKPAAVIGAAAPVVPSDETIRVLTEEIQFATDAITAAVSKLEPAPSLSVSSPKQIFSGQWWLPWFYSGCAALVLTLACAVFLYGSARQYTERKIEDSIAAIQADTRLNALTLQTLARANVSLTVTPDPAANRHFLRLEGVSPKIQAAPSPNGVAILFETP